jgi:hypothetical protein
MRTRLQLAALLSTLLIALPSFAQNHHSNWLHRNMMDTTIVQCWNDSMTTIHCPPGAMGMMMPDSMYCRMDIMPMDSLHHPHDSTHIGWCRIMMGEDSTHFGYMNCDSTLDSNHHQMQFMHGVRCEMRWDSLRCDSTRRHWRPTGIRGWTGSNWVTIPGVTFNGNTATFETTRLYSTYSFVGSPTNPTTTGEATSLPTSFELAQNYPNPFNPSTMIEFHNGSEGFISLKVYNLLGQEVASLMNEIRPAGNHQVRLDASSLASGIYLYKLQSGSLTRTMKMLLLR